MAMIFFYRKLQKNFLVDGYSDSIIYYLSYRTLLSGVFCLSGKKHEKLYVIYFVKNQQFIRCCVVWVA